MRADRGPRPAREHDTKIGARTNDGPGIAVCSGKGTFLLQGRARCGGDASAAPVRLPLFAFNDIPPPPLLSGQGSEVLSTATKVGGYRRRGARRSRYGGGVGRG